MPKTPTTRLVEVPGELDPHHPWIHEGKNREALTEFLTHHDIKINEAVAAKFTRDWFEVMIYVRDEHGQFVFTENDRDVQTKIVRSPYKEGSKPRILKGAYPRKVE